MKLLVALRGESLRFRSPPRSEAASLKLRDRLPELGSSEEFSASFRGGFVEAYEIVRTADGVAAVLRLVQRRLR